MMKKRDDIEKNRGRVREGDGTGSRWARRLADDGKRFVEVNGVNAVARNVSF